MKIKAVLSNQGYITDDSTAEASDIILDRVCYTALGRTVGKMPNNGAIKQTLNNLKSVYTIPAGYHNGQGTVSINPIEQEKLIPENIKSGVTLFGVKGADGIEKDVNFIDYDGRIVAGFTEDEFLKMSEMPENPTHEGLIPQGWNWTLGNAKAHVIKYKKLYIGQLYLPIDGKSIFEVSFQNTSDNKTFHIGTNGITKIDWGEPWGSQMIMGESINDLQEITIPYTKAGKYTITILPLEGEFSFSFNGAQYLTAAYIGNSCAIVGNEFTSCTNLKTISLPNNLQELGNLMFKNCISLKSLIVPSSIVNIPEEVCNNCKLSILSLPNSINSIAKQSFANSNLKTITIPSSVEIVQQKAFYSCEDLSSVVIPSNVQKIDEQAFANCKSLIKVTFKAKKAPELMINGFESLPEDCIIVIPHGTKIQYQTTKDYPASTIYVYLEED